MIIFSLFVKVCENASTCLLFIFIFFVKPALASFLSTTSACSLSLLVHAALHVTYYCIAVRDSCCLLVLCKVGSYMFPENDKGLLSLGTTWPFNVTHYGLSRFTSSEARVLLALVLLFKQTERRRPLNINTW